ncbi:hypothetical protein [Jiulongibacter sediminis]|jgi:hypothetical protein|uniref:hypothetical protein n=1 Tax=Jiulongibacter sediminis TaxID=1605367 RepID=UPI0026ED9E98|nr:hypothetical protein [Jiulongibacter sediminis]
MNKRTEEEIEKTLQLVDKIDKAEMPPFFYTRLKARMEKEIVANPKIAWLLKPAFVIPLLAITIAINSLTISTLLQNRSADPSEKEAFINEYNLSATYGVNLY